MLSRRTLSGSGSVDDVAENVEHSAQHRLTYGHGYAVFEHCRTLPHAKPLTFRQHYRQSGALAGMRRNLGVTRVPVRVQPERSVDFRQPLVGEADFYHRAVDFSDFTCHFLLLR